MPETDSVQIDFARHLIKCPHCEQQISKTWPGTVILYTPARCIHCGKDFVIALNQPRT